MKLPSIKNVDVKGKRVLLRAGFNVFGTSDKIDDIFRIKRALSTIELLKKRGAKVILLSHLSGGRSKSLKPIAKYLKIDFVPSVLGLKVKNKISKMKDGDVLLLENLRLDKREEKNSVAFAKELAKLGDIYVNDAFSASHRKHASVVRLPKYLPSYIGLLFQEEIKNLSVAFRPSHPFLIILGGIKFESKLGILDRFLKIADKIFIGGALANNFFKAQGLDIGRSVFDKKVNIKKHIKNKKIVLPIDMVIKNNQILDFGPKTISELKKLINQSKFILWNGPLGNLERGFERGTIAVAKAIANSDAKTIIGGGDTIGFIEEFGLLKKFSFVSTGGGAMLAFLANGTLPGIEALRKK